MTGLLVRAETERRVRVVLVDNPPVNALSPGVPEALEAAIDAAEADPAIEAIIVMAAGRTFVAGADIRTLEALAWDPHASKPELHDLLARVEDAAKPVVMAIHGAALGGGLELAMAGHYRVAVASATLGLPECALGLIPGGEGTQRLPRLVGVEKALNMVVTSQAIAAADARTHGLLDALIEGDLREGAVAFAEGVVAKDEPHPKTRDRADKLGTPKANASLYEAARALARTARPQQPAPLKAIDAIELATRLPFAQGCAREAELFLEVVRTEPAKALIHLFFAERAAGKVAGLQKDTKGAPVRRVGIIGAGTIGGGIAMICTNAGFEVILQDSSQNALDLAGFDRTDIIIEAMFEDMSLKQQVFREIDRVARPGAVFATNTSTLDIDALAAGTSRAEDVIGLHFFSPADVVRLLEIVRGTKTSATTLATTLNFAKALGKVGVVVANSPGVVGSRMMSAYWHETQSMVEEGATPQQIDAALTGFGMVMAARPDPKDTDLIRTKAREARIPRRSFTHDQIVERAILALINEGARALELGLTERASDIDIIHVHGYGFPAWRGGPMFHADRLGLGHIRARLQSFQGELGDRWTPAPLLERLAAVGGTFRGLDRR